MKYLRSITTKTSNIKPKQLLGSKVTTGGFLLLAGAGVSLASYQLYKYKALTTQKIRCESIHSMKKSNEIGRDGDVDMRTKMTKFVLDLQADICKNLSEVDGTSFKTDRYLRPNNSGESISCVLEDGNVLGRGGVNVSIVNGKLPPQAVRQMRSEVGDKFQGNQLYPFFTASISLVLHPKNPFAPTVHLNYRYFEVDSDEGLVWWFGGGSDLTPAFLDESDSKHFHSTLKQSLDNFDTTYYPKFKSWCDKYFYNSHRQECRGVGGIFFDDVDFKYGDKETLFAMVQACGKSFLPSYIPILLKRKDTPFTAKQLEWQQVRRGRYVEFNLLHDRGTKFGLLAPNPKVESILVSLPPVARWGYNIQPEKGSKEAELIDVLKHPRNWA